MKTNKLKMNPNNPRRIQPDKLEKLCASITNLPQMMTLRPIVYDPVTMHVLGGNQRLAAIRKLGMKEIPDEWAIAATDLTPEQQKEFVLRDNVQLGDWDYSVLDENFADFDLDDIGIELPSLSEDDLQYSNLHEEILDGADYFSVTFTISNKYKDKFYEIGKKAFEDAILGMMG